MEPLQGTSFRTVNPLLGQRPAIGPIPAEQVIPWSIWLMFTYLLGSFFSLDYFAMGAMAIWGMATWWVLTGSRPWRFLAKFHPKPRWTRGLVRYNTLVEP